MISQHGVWATLGRILLLYILGIAYGLVVGQLHDTAKLAPVRVHVADRRSFTYLALWGLAGVILGVAVPWFDLWWEGKQSGDREAWRSGDSGRGGGADGMGRMVVAWQRRGGTAWEQWYEAVRSVAAFVGVAFAIVSMNHFLFLFYPRICLGSLSSSNCF